MEYWFHRPGLISEDQMTTATLNTRLEATKNGLAEIASPARFTRRTEPAAILEAVRSVSARRG